MRHRDGAALLLLSVIAAAGPARADDALFKAMSMLAMGAGMPDALPPDVRHGNYVDLRFMGVTAFGDVLSPGPGGCSVVQTSVTQERGGFAQLSVKTYDFSRVTGVRYLAADDDFVSALSRQPGDPKVDTISIDGRSWQCQRVIHIDPAAPAFAQHCDDGWQIALVGAADKASAMAAIELVGKACFAK